MDLTDEWGWYVDIENHNLYNYTQLYLTNTDILLNVKNNKDFYQQKDVKKEKYVKEKKPLHKFFFYKLVKWFIHSLFLTIKNIII